VANLVLAIDQFVVFVLDLLAFYAFFLILSVSLNLEFGYAGIPNFGKVLSFMAGAFVVGALPGRLIMWLAGLQGDWIVDNSVLATEATRWLQQHVAEGFGIFFLTIGVAMGVGLGVGYLSAIPAIRLREDYLAITLLAFGEGGRVIGINVAPIVGGTLGVAIPDPLGWIAGDIRFPVASMAVLGFAILVYVYAERFIRSPLGRMLRAVRDSEPAAASLGKDITRTRLKIFLIGSILGALGGALFGFYQGSVHPFGFTRTEWTFWPWVMVLLGGAANNVGAAAGTMVFVAGRKLTSFYKGVLQPIIPFNLVWLDLILLGGVLLAVLMLRPHGILPEKPTPTVRLEPSPASTVPAPPAEPPRH
jgi:branched-chain amino acid transport system permease protein